MPRLLEEEAEAEVETVEADEEAESFDEDAAEPSPAVSEDLGEFTDEEEVEDDADVPFLEDDDEDEFDETEIEGLPGEGADDR